MKTKNGENVSVEEITAENYFVPKGEERLFHVKFENVSYNPKTGKKISRPVIQKFGKKMYQSIMERQLKRAGYNIDVLHNPVEWEAQNAAKLAAARAEQEKARREAAAKAEAEKTAAMESRIRAKLIEELKEAGLLAESKKGRSAKKEEE